MSDRFKDWLELKKTAIGFEIVEIKGLNNCSCGGKPIAYIQGNPSYSFGNMSVRCSGCMKSITECYDKIGKVTDVFKKREMAEHDLKKRWNNN